MEYFTYMMASQNQTTLYVGVTNDLIRRVYQHKTGTFEGFTKKYQVHHLVWFESHQDIREAIAREKQLKGWMRQWKIDLIEKNNPEWADLYGALAVNP